jgi:Domain of unknown function (DUF1814).
VLIGGVAASVLARPRLTRDIDLLAAIDESRFEEALRLAKRHWLSARAKDAAGFAKRSRVLLLRHLPSRIDVDVAIADLPFEKEAVARGTVVRAGAVSLPVARAEDLIVMKAVANRPRDLVDIEALLDSRHRLDFGRIRRLLHKFSKALAMPEILG